MMRKKNTINVPFFERRVYFCIKIVLGEKNIDFFSCKEHDLLFSWEEKMLKYSVGFFFKHVFYESLIV